MAYSLLIDFKTLKKKIHRCLSFCFLEMVSDRTGFLLKNSVPYGQSKKNPSSSPVLPRQQQVGRYSVASPSLIYKDGNSPVIPLHTTTSKNTLISFSPKIAAKNQSSPISSNRGRIESEKIAGNIQRRKTKGKLAVALAEDLNQLYWNYDFYDIVFKCAHTGDTICAHKVILNARVGRSFVEKLMGTVNDARECDYFPVSDSNGVETIFVDIEGGFEVLKDTMKFLYCGQLFWDGPIELNLIVAKLYLLLRFSEKFSLRGLNEKCSKLLKRCHDGDIEDYESFKTFNRIEVDNDSSGALLECICPGKDKAGEEPPAQVLHSSFLGKDLGTVLNDRATSDVTFVVEGQKLYAHKAIVCARSEFFRAMLDGPWMEGETNEIHIRAVGKSSFQHVLHFLYAGVVDIENEEESLQELLTIGDMYDVQGLKVLVSNIAWTAKCHSFHEPCESCMKEVPFWLNMADKYGMQELKMECIRWLSKHMMKLWPQRSFASLSSNILDEIYSYQISVMNDDKTFLKIFSFLINCDKAIGLIENGSGSCDVLDVVAQCKQQCIARICKNFRMIRYNSDFLGLIKGCGWSFHLIKDIIECLSHLTTAENCFDHLTYAQHIAGLISQYGPTFEHPSENPAVKMQDHVMNVIASNLTQLRSSVEYAGLGDDIKAKIDNLSITICRMDLTFRGKLDESKMPISLRRRMQSKSHKAKRSSTSLSITKEVLVPGQRVSLTEGRVGIIRFVGKTCFAEGMWYGVELDEPTGRHDGEVQKVRYFTTSRNCGTFVKISSVVEIL